MKVQRLRGRALQKRRARWFAEHPLCVHCKRAGRVTPATELDHIVALDNGGSDDASNLQGLCETCHEVKTAKDLGFVQRSGAEASGMPSERTHHWNR